MHHCHFHWVASQFTCRKFAAGYLMLVSNYTWRYANIHLAYHCLPCDPFLIAHEAPSAFNAGSMRLSHTVSTANPSWRNKGGLKSSVYPCLPFGLYTMKKHTHPGASRTFQGPPGASRGLQKSSRQMRLATYFQWARLKFHAGWSGWTGPPTMAEGGRVGHDQRWPVEGGV